MVKSNAQEALDTLVKGFRNKSGKSDPKWESKLSPTEKKRLASARKLAKATEGKIVSLGQRTAEAFLPDLPRGKTGTKREVAEKAQRSKDEQLIKDIIAQGKKDAASVKKLKKEKEAEPLDEVKKFEHVGISLYKKLEKLVKAKTPASVNVSAKEAEKVAKALRTAASLDEDTSWKKGHDPVTKFMEELLGTKRTVAQVKKDMDASKTSEDEMLEFYGKKRGGKVTTKRPSTKKYAMNRGGKVASVRKPTRA
jgi:hypothetical protein